MIEADRYWKNFIEAIGHPELGKDERFADAFARYHNSSELVLLLDALFAEKTLEEWTEDLEGHRRVRAGRHQQDWIVRGGGPPFGALAAVVR